MENSGGQLDQNCTRIVRYVPRKFQPRAGIPRDFMNALATMFAPRVNTGDTCNTPVMSLHGYARQARTPRSTLRFSPWKRNFALKMSFNLIKKICIYVRNANFILDVCEIRNSYLVLLKRETVFEHFTAKWTKNQKLLQFCKIARECTLKILSISEIKFLI